MILILLEGWYLVNKKLKNLLYITLAFIFVAIGAIGVILPVLPTTPFLLLASFFFTRGSDRFNNWFISTKLYKNHLETFIENRTMELKTKVKLLLFASSVLLISGYSVKILPFRIFIGIVMIYLYYYFIFRIKTIKK